MNAPCHDDYVGRCGRRMSVIAGLTKGGGRVLRKSFLCRRGCMTDSCILKADGKASSSQHNPPPKSSCCCTKTGRSVGTSVNFALVSCCFMTSARLVKEVWVESSKAEERHLLRRQRCSNAPRSIEDLRPPSLHVTVRSVRDEGGEFCFSDDPVLAL